MKKSKNVAIRVNPKLKSLAEKTFKALGMNMHAGIILLLSQMQLRGKVPFQAKLEHPDAEYVSDELTVSLIVKADEDIKNQCVEIAHRSGLTFSLVISMYLVQVVDKQAIPFEILASPEESEA